MIVSGQLPKGSTLTITAETADKPEEWVVS
jgi:hypothetical protein